LRSRSGSPAKDQLDDQSDQSHHHDQLDQEPHHSGDESEDLEGHEQRDEPASDDQYAIEDAQPMVLFAPGFDALSSSHKSRVTDTGLSATAAGPVPELTLPR
jgi:hypothetical protein